MIAQGDFLKLLLAPTEERKTIFRQIFKTELYQNLQDKLKRESGELNDRCAAARSSIRQYVNGIVCDDNDVLSVDVEKAKDGSLPADDVLELAEKLLEQDQSKYSELQTIIAEAEKQLEAVNENLGRIEAAEKVRLSLEQAKTRLAAETEAHKTLEAAFAAEEGKASEIEKLSAEKARIEAEYPRYDALTEFEDRIGIDEADIAEAEIRLVREQEQYKLDSEAFTKLKAEFDSLSNAGEGREKLVNQRGKIEERLSRLCALSDSFELYYGLSSSLTRLQSEYKTASDLRLALCSEVADAAESVISRQYLRNPPRRFGSRPHEPV